MDATLNRLQKKLDRWELDHLRQHASDLACRLELAEEQASQERANSDYWRDRCEEMWREMTEDNGQLGLTIDGRVIAIVNQEMVTTALDQAEEFLCGFEDDPEQTSVPVALAWIRCALNSIRGDQPT